MSINICIHSGRPTTDPVIRYNTEGSAVARFTLAINTKKDRAEFPSFVAFGKQAELCEKYVKKGQFIEITSHVSTGSYDKDGTRIKTTDFIIDRIEFTPRAAADNEQRGDGFMNIPEGIEDEVPFE